MSPVKKADLTVMMRKQWTTESKKGYIATCHIDIYILPNKKYWLPRASNLAV